MARACVWEPRMGVEMGMEMTMGERLWSRCGGRGGDCWAAESG